MNTTVLTKPSRSCLHLPAASLVAPADTPAEEGTAAAEIAVGDSPAVGMAAAESLAAESPVAGSLAEGNLQQEESMLNVSRQLTEPSRDHVQNRYQVVGDFTGPHLVVDSCSSWLNFLPLASSLISDAVSRTRKAGRQVRNVTIEV